jgi:hypothetical protein
MGKYDAGIKGNLDIFIIQNDDDEEIPTRQEILIHGDPEGLRSLAALLLKLADLDQNNIADLPIGAREHIHLKPGHGISNSSERVIIGRLDAKGTAAFYDRYIPSKK